MKLYNSVGPNPRVVTMFIAEKGIDIETIEVDIMSGENRQEAYLKKNPGGQSPALEMANGEILSEITPICDYLDEKFPANSLMGETLEEKAQTRMWCRRIDIKITEPMANGFRFGEGIDLFKDRMACFPESSADLKALAQDGLKWLDALLTDEFICGQRFSLADIHLFCFLDFFAGMGQPVSPELKNVSRWMEAMRQRPSVEASVHPSMRG
jgi:glutathione S-transferase